MFNKKLISTVLSALTLFPTFAPLVSAIGSQTDEQPQPSNTAPASAPEATETGGTTPPEQKRQRQAEPQPDTTTTTEREQSDGVDFHLKEAYACLNAVENFGTKFKAEVEKNPDYIFTNFFSLNKNSEFMDELYALLSKLIVHLDALDGSATFSLEENNKLNNTIRKNFENLDATILDALKRDITRFPELNEDYEKIQLNKKDLYELYGNSICHIRNLLTNYPKDIQSKNILFYLYLHSLTAEILGNINGYFLCRKWNINKPIVLDPESANKHLKNFLSTNIKQIVLHIWSSLENIPAHIFRQIANIDKILSLEISGATDIHPNVLLDFLETFKRHLGAQRVITDPFYTSKYLTFVYCFSPMCKTEIPAEDTEAIKSKLQKVNTQLFKKIENRCFRMFSESKDTLCYIFGERDSLFDPTLSPDEYYDRFTKRIIEYPFEKLIKYPPCYQKNIHFQLYKLSVLANILIGIQYDPYGIQSLFEKLEHQIKIDRLKTATRLSIPDSELDIPPFELKKEGVFLEKLLSLKFFYDFILHF